MSQTYYVCIVNEESERHGQTGRIVNIDRSRPDPCEVAFPDGETVWFQWGNFFIVQTHTRTISPLEANKRSSNKEKQQ